ncbi:hypothetical protein Syn6312_2156 [Synechococcus sp. PCC 6312]|nr:hypothetical protein Syn6312_2156 [Synechococcus sp. PCC 6312]
MFAPLHALIYGLILEMRLSLLSLGKYFKLLSGLHQSPIFNVFSLCPPG